MNELRSVEFHRSRLPNINEITAGLQGKSRGTSLNRPPMTRLKRLEKGLAPINWNSTTTEIRDLVELKGKVRPSTRSTFDGLFPARITHTSSNRRTSNRGQSLESHPEYMPPMKDYNYKFDLTVQYREALLRVAAISNPNRR